MASMTKDYLVFTPDRVVRKSDLLLEQPMTILYLEDIKRSRAESAGMSNKLSAMGAGGVVELAERRQLWPSIVRRLQMPLQVRKLKNYARSSSWLPAHSSQCLEPVHVEKS